MQTAAGGGRSGVCVCKRVGVRARGAAGRA